MTNNKCKKCKGKGRYINEDNDNEEEVECDKCEGTGVAEIDFSEFEINYKIGLDEEEVEEDLIDTENEEEE